MNQSEIHECEHNHRPQHWDTFVNSVLATCKKNVINRIQHQKSITDKFIYSSGIECK